MALKGKAKKQKRRAKPVARPPKAALEKRSPQKRRIDIFIVLAALFVVTMVGVVIWAIIVSTQPKEVAGLDDYITASTDQRRELANVSDELADAASQISEAAPDADLAATYERVVNLGQRAQVTVQALTPQSQSAAPEFRTAATLLAASAQTLSQGVQVLESTQNTEDRAMAAQLARKAARIASASDAMRTSGERAIGNLRDENAFETQASDVAPYVAPEDLQEGPPLDGILDEVPSTSEGGSPVAVDTSTPIELNLATVPVADYGTTATTALGDFDKTVGNTGAKVSAAETSRDFTALQLEATKWFAATRTAFGDIAGVGRPDKDSIDDVALLNALWLVQESSRSFASTATDTPQADALMTGGKNLRLVADELRQAAAIGLARNGVVLPSAPETGFDPTAIGLAPAVPEESTAPGGLPGGGLPGGGDPGGIPISPGS